MNDQMVLKIEIDLLNISPEDAQYLIDLLEIIKRRPSKPIVMEQLKDGR